MKPNLLILLSGLFFLTNCKKDENDPVCTLSIASDARIFEFKHDSTGDTYLAWTSKPDVINQVLAQLALPENERSQHINGKINFLPDGCSLNQKWSWYFEPNDWVMADISAEVCDGNPQFVEENLDEFVNNVGRYCPWGGRVVREVEQ